MAEYAESVVLAGPNNVEGEKVNKNTRFRWSQGDKVYHLIQCLAQYKSTMEYNSCDFSADKVKLYEALRQAMAKIYFNQPSFFGPVCVTPLPMVEECDLEEKERILKQQKEDKDMIRKGYSRIQEKLKEIRQNFSKAITTGSRSGSGKIVLEHYDQLVEIWGGSPATKPLKYGTNTDEINDTHHAQTTSIVDTENNLPDIDGSPSDINVNNEVELSDEEDNNEDMPPSTLKRKRCENPIPRLIDNKRKHLQRQLSAVQRDQILLNESKEEAQTRKNIAEAISQSNQTFSQCIQQMSMSILQVAQSLTRSVEVMSQAMAHQSTIPYHQPMPHQTFSSYQYSQMFPAANDSQQTNNSGSNNESLKTIDVSQWEQLH